MFQFMLLLFIAIPLLEIYLLIQVGSVIGAVPTVALVVFTAILGVWLLRMQGLATVGTVQRQLSQGQLPAIPLLEGMLLLVAGAMLLTPGFFTDGIGFALLIPPLRQGLARWLLRQGWWNFTQGPRGRQGPSDGPSTIEGEYTRQDENNDRFPR